jgi:hypothetical protein
MTPVMQIGSHWTEMRKSQERRQWTDQPGITTKNSLFTASRPLIMWPQFISSHTRDAGALEFTLFVRCSLCSTSTSASASLHFSSVQCPRYSRQRHLRAEVLRSLQKEFEARTECKLMKVMNNPKMHNVQVAKV